MELLAGGSTRGAIPRYARGDSSLCGNTSVNGSPMGTSCTQVGRSGVMENRQRSCAGERDVCRGWDTSACGVVRLTFCGCGSVGNILRRATTGCISQVLVNRTPHDQPCPDFAQLYFSSTISSVGTLGSLMFVKGKAFVAIEKVFVCAGCTTTSV